VIGIRRKTVAGGESETVLQNRLTTIEADDEQTVAKVQREAARTRTPSTAPTRWR
jgi:hypothetical protein